MARKILASVERLLITAASLLLAAIVVAMFVRAVRAPVGGAAAATPAPRPPVTSATATTTSPPRGVVTTTTTPDGGAAATEAPAVTFPDGPCEEDVPAAEEGTTTLRVFYTCGNASVPTADSFVYRLVPQTPRVLGATLSQLVKGPTNAEEELGFRSVFTIADASAVDSVSLSAGEAVIDFVSLPEITDLAADDAAFFVANLNANVFQYATIRSVEYRIGGSCAAFWAHLGDGSGCRIIARENFEAEMAANRLP